MRYRQPLPFKQHVVKSKPIPGPETNPWWWNPNRVGVKLAPADFRKKLKDLGEELEATWNPLTERWYLWAKAPKINHKICQGWRLLFVNSEPDGSYLPLDERVFARLYKASALSGENALQYFDRVVREMQRDKEKAEAETTAETVDIAMESFKHGQIQVSGAGHSNGSKFSTYLS